MRVHAIGLRAGLALTLAALLGLAACNRNSDETSDQTNSTSVPSTEVPAETAEVPLSYGSRTSHAEVSLTLPDAVRRQPELHARLYREGVRTLQAFSEGAQADRTEFGGDVEIPRYSSEIAWQQVTETGKLFSIRGTVYEYTGGAHPNGGLAAVLWDKALRREVDARSLFRSGANLSALDEALCEAINRARRDRVGADAETLTLGGASGTWSCPAALETPYALAASTQSGKAGGLIFLIGPYIVGPYAEGAYEVVVPQQAFRSLLASAYADEFAGQPRPLPASQGG